MFKGLPRGGSKCIALYIKLNFVLKCVFILAECGQDEGRTHGGHEGTERHRNKGGFDHLQDLMEREQQ